VLAVALQSEGSHELKFDCVYQIMVFTLNRSANCKCPKCGKIVVLQFGAFVILIPTFEDKGL
jgi:hypothetical protein